MAQKNRDSPPGYMDGVCVKIAERYKPPKRILLPTTNTQRMTADILCSPVFNYDFTREMSVREKMMELRAARASLKTERTQRLQQQRQHAEQYWNDVREAESSSETEVTGSESAPVVVAADAGRVLPPVSSSSSVLTPIPMCRKSATPPPPTHAPHNPINISDFENDTASPFDNMELKTLNDLAELAEVLQQQQAVHSAPAAYNHTSPAGYGPHHPEPRQPPPPNGYYNNYTSPPGPLAQFIMFHPNTYYKYPMPESHSTNSNTISPPQSAAPAAVATTTPTPVVPEDTISRSVPDIMYALQRELAHSRIDDTCLAALKHDPDPHPATTTAPASLANPYSTLTPRLQQLAKEVSLMGFPLDRVARACSIIGDDQSRLIEHMIAMSQLLDLGFTEPEVTKALLRCNSDRDKALDFLVA